MSNTARINLSLSISSGELNYQSRPTSFTDTSINSVNPAKGGSPGNVSAPVGGVDVSLAALVSPGYCWMQNLSDTYSCEYGIRDTLTNVFYPFGWLMPGMPDTFRFSPNIGNSESPGTGSHAPAGSTVFHIRGVGGVCQVVVNAFEG